MSQVGAGELVRSTGACWLLNTVPHTSPTLFLMYNVYVFSLISSITFFRFSILLLF